MTGMLFWVRFLPKKIDDSLCNFLIARVHSIQNLLLYDKVSSALVMLISLCVDETLEREGDEDNFDCRG